MAVTRTEFVTFRKQPKMRVSTNSRAEPINQPGIEGAQMRPLKTFIIAPSVHLSDVAKQHQKDMPALIHYFLSSLGRDAASCSDLMSYLLFTPQYTRELIEIGYHDASKRIDEIENSLYSSQRETLRTHWPAKREGGRPRQVRP